MQILNNVIFKQHRYCIWWLNNTKYVLKQQKSEWDVKCFKKIRMFLKRLCDCYIT